jgi:hypothetical protein
MENESMSTNQNHIDDLLLEGGAESMRAAAEHAASCTECAESLAAWNEISGTARSMRATWKSDLLWPRIERSLRQERKGSRIHLWQIAAAIVLTIGLGAAVWRVVHVRSEAAAFDRAILKRSALDQVEQAERAHVKAIEQLEQVAEPRLEEPATPLMISYKEKLVLLDDAIAECERNIGQNRKNAHLRKQLLSMYVEKQRTLQEVLREDSHVANQ